MLNGQGHPTFCDDAMDMRPTTPASTGVLHPEYLRAFDDLERRVARGEVPLAQARREIHALRERYTDGRPVALYSPDRCW